MITRASGLSTGNFPQFSHRQGRSKVRKPVPPPSQTGGIKSRRRIPIRRYTRVAAFGRKPLNFPRRFALTGRDRRAGRFWSAGATAPLSSPFDGRDSLAVMRVDFVL
jgi:hypothetical protein